MAKVLTVAALTETLRNVRSEVFATIPAHSHTFKAKIFKRDFLKELCKLPQDAKTGLIVVEREDSVVIQPGRKLMNAIRENGFSTAKSMKGEQFADTVKTTKGTLWVKFPTSCNNKEIRVKVAKKDFADNVRQTAADETTHLRIYGRDTGDMVVRSF